MTTTTIREFRKSLRAHLTSDKATLIRSGKGWTTRPRAILIPIPEHGYRPGEKRHAIAQAKRLFRQAIATAD